MKLRPVGAELFHVDGRTDGQTERQMDRCDEADMIFAILRTCLKMLIFFLYMLAIVSEQIYARMRTLLCHEYVYGSGGKTPRKFNCLNVSYTADLDDMVKKKPMSLSEPFSRRVRKIA